MSIVPSIKLNNGRSIPVLGLGTWLSEPGEVGKAVKEALKIGYRHIDCAHVYGNEAEIGEALKEAFKSGLKREDLFITSKLWNTFHRYEDVRKGFELSLKNLGLDYIDLFLIHWPMSYEPSTEVVPKDGNGQVRYADCDYLDTWRAMEELVDQGLIKSIGLSNFSISQTQRVLKNCRVKPAMVQVEIHPKFANKKLVDFCHDNGLAVTAYSPLGNNGIPKDLSDKPWSLLEDKRVQKIAEKYSKSPAQVLIRFAIDRGICVIPKSVHEDRLKSNFDVFDFKLSPSEVNELLNFHDQQRVVNMPWDVNNKYYPFNEDQK